VPIDIMKKIDSRDTLNEFMVMIDELDSEEKEFNEVIMKSFTEF